MGPTSEGWLLHGKECSRFSFFFLLLCVHINKKMLNGVEIIILYFFLLIQSCHFDTFFFVTLLTLLFII